MASFYGYLILTRLPSESAALWQLGFLVAALILIVAAALPPIYVLIYVVFRAYSVEFLGQLMPAIALEPAVAPVADAAGRRYPAPRAPR